MDAFLNAVPAYSNTSVLDYAINDSPVGMSLYRTAPSTTDNPTSGGSYFFVVFNHAIARRVFGIPIGNNRMFSNYYSNGSWSGWEEYSRAT